MDGAGQQMEYEYDENGNLTKDLNKNILRITYNFLNLPKEIMFMDGSYIHYTYDAAGTLLRKGYYVGEELELLDEEPIEIPDIEYTEEESINPMAQLMSNDEPIEEDLEPIEVEEEILYTDVIDYCGNCIYENGTLKTILVEGGYIIFDSSQPVYHFYLKDHLGNNRVVANASGQVEQVNHYYPYGGLMAKSTCGDVQRYKYNGKELDRMLGLDWYDYGARHYDGALTMWRTMDPLCEKYYGISPYVYCRNNPILRIDIDGLYDFESISNWSNPIIAVFPIAEQRDETIQLDYQSAHDASVPIITVENIADFCAALSDLNQKGIPFESIAINSHGSYYGFKIGSEEVNLLSDLSCLENGLKGKTLFIGACNVGNNVLLVNQIAEDTQSTVIAPKHKLPAGYQYNGSNYLNSIGEKYLPTFSPAQYYLSNGIYNKTVTNVSIDKNKGVEWDGFMLFFNKYK